MSHEILENDKHEGTSMGWHGLTDVKAVILLATCWLATWDIKIRALFRKVMIDGNEELQETGYGELVCTDNENIAVGKSFSRHSYSVFSNAAFLRLVAACIEKLPGAIIQSVGSLKNRSLIFLAISIPEYYTTEGKTIAASFNAAGRDFKCFLNFLSSHDKSTGLTVVMSNICTVCFNTFSANLMVDGEKTFKACIRHTSNMSEYIADVPSMVEAFFMTVEHFKNLMNQLFLIPITENDAKAFFVGFLSAAEKFSDADLSKTELPSRRFNTATRLTELFKTGKGNTGANLSDVFNAITDYYTHESVISKGSLSQIDSSEVGLGQAQKALAYVLLQDDIRIKRTIVIGHLLLANYEAEKS